MSRDCGTLRLRTQLLICVSLTVLGGTSCGALSIFASSLFHLYRVNIFYIEWFCRVTSKPKWHKYYEESLAFSKYVFFFFFALMIDQNAASCHSPTINSLCVCLAGTQAADGRKIFESHAESGKILSLNIFNLFTLTSSHGGTVVVMGVKTWFRNLPKLYFKIINYLINLSRCHWSINNLKMVQLMLNPSARLKNVVAPPCCLKVLCRKWGMTCSYTSAFQPSSCYRSCSARPLSSTGSAIWGTTLKYWSIWEVEKHLPVCE